MPPRMSLIPYLGGKQALVPVLLPLIPPHTLYVEVFGGGGALLLNKPPSEAEAYNDLDGDLVNLFEVIRDNVEGFLGRADFLLYSRELHRRWLEDLETGVKIEDPVERAVRFWFVLRSSFAGCVGKGWRYARGSPRQQPMTLQNSLQRLRAIHERLKGVEIDCLDFRRCITNRDDASSFLFLDPPYLDLEGYRTGTFSLQDHEDLAETLRHVKARWLLTVGDHPKIRRLYTGFSRKRLISSIASEKVVGGKRRSLTNLLIYNYAPPKIPLYVAAASQPALLDIFGQ